MEDSTNVIPEDWRVDENKCVYPSANEDANRLAKDRDDPAPTWKNYRYITIDSSRKYAKN